MRVKLCNQKGEVCVIRKIFYIIGGMYMDLLKENEAFCVGVAFGVDLYQRKIIEAHRRGKPLMVDGNLYYLEDGRERLARVIDEICK